MLDSLPVTIFVSHLEQDPIRLIRLLLREAAPVVHQQVVVLHCSIYGLGLKQEIGLILQPQSVLVATLDSLGCIHADLVDESVSTVVRNQRTFDDV